MNGILIGRNRRKKIIMRVDVGRLSKRSSRYEIYVDLLRRGTDRADCILQHPVHHRVESRIVFMFLRPSDNVSTQAANQCPVRIVLRWSNKSTDQYSPRSRVDI